MEAFGLLLHGFAVLMTWKIIALMLVGLVLGIFVGVLPGLGPTATISLLLPISVYLDRTSSIILMSGIYYGAMYGGSITSILIKIPGEAVIDGKLVPSLSGKTFANVTPRSSLCSTSRCLAQTPAVGAERPFQVAPRVEKTLANGLQVIVTRQTGVPKVTVMLTRPSPIDDDDRYSMSSTPLICCSRGAATSSAIVSAEAPG